MQNEPNLIGGALEGVELFSAEFIDENGGEPGVRLRKRYQKRARPRDTSPAEPPNVLAPGYRLASRAGSTLRQGEDHARRCDTAERMRSKRDQRRRRFGGKRAGHKDRLAQWFAQPLQPADQIDGGADGGEI